MAPFSHRARARSRRKLLWALAFSCAPLAAACNAIVGLSDYSRGECSGGGICADSGVPDAVTPDSSPDGRDGAAEAGRGADPVSWARWRMPSYVLPDGAAPGTAPALAVAGAEVVDGVTGLVWRRVLEGGTATLVPLEIAEATCRSVAPAGQWRVPKRIELVTLLDYGHPKPFIDTKTFAGFAPTRVWTSSELRPLAGGAAQRYWTVNFDTGAVETELGTSAAAATLCVKAKP